LTGLVGDLELRRTVPTRAPVEVLLVHEAARAGVDEAFLDVTRRCEGSFDQTEALAHEVQQAVIAHTRITSSIGIGPNKLVAKIASSKQKPAGLTVVRPEEVRQFLAPLPVRELPGVGKKTERTLRDLGI
jgi:DNA polymerase IV (DinB-like DNA polymerase)